MCGVWAPTTPGPAGHRDRRIHAVGSLGEPTRVRSPEFTTEYFRHRPRLCESPAAGRSGTLRGVDGPKNSAAREAPKAATEPAAGLASPVRALRGVGSDRLAQLERLGIRTVGDLLLHAPRRYEDRRHFMAIREVREGAPATVRGRVVAAGVNRFRSGKSVFELIVDDGTARLHCR
ncbi:MAG: hypothetical protein KIT22_10755, partial [Verrucomicrobiae bacterium]|nr:hypothetical protein [Verrucomicrobiae bacterium]